MDTDELVILPIQDKALLESALHANIKHQQVMEDLGIVHRGNIEMIACELMLRMVQLSSEDIQIPPEYQCLLAFRKGLDLLLLRVDKEELDLVRMRKLAGLLDERLDQWR
jgi:hypothetical protein